MIEVSRLSRRYSVRPLGDDDVDDVLALCVENPQFYRYCEEEPTREQVLLDMRITPPGIGPSQKYYVGFFQGGELVAVLDLIDGYPAPETAYIGFFMLRLRLQGKGTGSALIREVTDCLKSAGKTAVRLAINKGNPQSTHFWEKNGFAVIREVRRNGWTLQEAERIL